MFGRRSTWLMREELTYGFPEPARRRRSASSILDKGERAVCWDSPGFSSRRDSSDRRCGMSCRNTGTYNNASFSPILAWMSRVSRASLFDIAFMASSTLFVAPIVGEARPSRCC
jgi:hypothetical protein